MQLTLIVPAPFATISGGYAYDRHIVAGLRARGHTVSVVELPGRFPLADQVARDAACAAWDRLPSDTLPIIDGLALPAFAGLEDALAARRSIGLVHHPVSLETGLSEDDIGALRTMEQRLFAHLSRIVVTSEATAALLAKEFAILRSRIVVVIPGTAPAPRSPGSGGPTCQILSVGALIPRKGHDLLLRALARLFDLNWHLTIVGSPDRDPVHANGLVALAQQLGIAQHVTFAGELDDAALQALWQRTDILALATQFEGYGMAIAEALKRGVPVAVTAGGAVESLVPAEAGTVSPLGDRDQLSKSLRRLIFSPELRAELAEAAWQAGQALPDWDTQAAAFAAAIG